MTLQEAQVNGARAKCVRRSAWTDGRFIRYVSEQPKAPNAPTLPTLPAWYTFKVGEVPSVYQPSSTDSNANDWIVVQ